MDDYCGLLGFRLSRDNVTDGTNAFLVALERDRGVLVSEAEIVARKGRTRSLTCPHRNRPLSEDDRAALGASVERAVRKALEDRSRTMPLNPRLRERIAAADLITTPPEPSTRACFPPT